MKKTLKKLTLLQEVDAKIYALRARSEEIPRQIEEQVRAVERARSLREAVDDRARELRKSIDAGQLELKGYEERIYQKEVQLNTISTNDAYKAMLREIAGLKADRSRVEDAILEQSYAQDELASEIREAEKVLEAARQEHDLRQQELKAQSAVLDGEIAELEQRRSAFVDGVHAEALKVYQRVLDRRSGQAMSPARDRHCQGCQMNLTLQEMTVLLSCKEILTCRTCSRILYLEEVVDPIEV